MFAKLAFALILFVAHQNIAHADQPLDAIVVGGGLAGLSAARTLVDQGYSVVVLEANDRVGGRTWTKWSNELPDGGWVDMGGQWIGPGMEHILPLAEEFGVETFPSHFQGNIVCYFQGQRLEFSAPGGLPRGDSFPLPDADIAEFRAIVQQIDQLASEIPPEAPWEAPHAAEWDSQTVATWMQPIVTPGARFLLKTFVEGYFASEPSDVSLLHFLFYIRAGGGFNQLESSGIARRFVKGSQQISQGLAAYLGDSVLLNTPVTKITQTEDAVVVSTERGDFQAKHVIVAMAPPLAARISYQPQLNANRDQFTQRAPMGSSIKLHVVYKTPFWRNQGLAGSAFSDADPISQVVDNSPPDHSIGILGAFLEGKHARLWEGSSEEELEQLAIETFVKFFGPEAADNIGFFKADWANEPWSRGCFTSVLPPGAWTGFPGAMRTPVGNIHWAGTETATKWYAYMDGAVSSGKRAAQEVVDALNGL